MRVGASGLKSKAQVGNGWCLGVEIQGSSRCVLVPRGGRRRYRPTPIDGLGPKSEALCDVAGGSSTASAPNYSTTAATKNFASRAKGQLRTHASPQRRSTSFRAAPINRALRSYRRPKAHRRQGPRRVLPSCLPRPPRVGEEAHPRPPLARPWPDLQARPRVRKAALRPSSNTRP